MGLVADVDRLGVAADPRRDLRAGTCLASLRQQGSTDVSWRSMLRNWAIGTGAIAAVSVAAPMITNADSAPIGEPFPGMQGTDTALPLTDSAVTVTGRGQFANLTITVNQTHDLVNQAVSVTWTGGTPTEPSQRSRFGSHFLQVMECWGDDDGEFAENPGPPPEQCVWGGVGGVPTELPATL